MAPLNTIISDLLRSFRYIRHERKEYTGYAITLAVGLVLCITALYGFIDITEALLSHQITAFDNAIARPIIASRTSALTAVLSRTTHLGDVIAYSVFMLATAVYFYFRRHNWLLSIQIGTVLASTGAINLILKNIIGRERPPGEHLVVVSAQSFPSGHAMSSIAFYGFLIYIAWNYLPRMWMKISATFALSALVIVIGISRIYLGVHYPSDVAAGFAGGLCWMVVCILAFRTLRLYTNRRKRKREQAHA